jgi:amidase
MGLHESHLLAHGPQQYPSLKLWSTKKCSAEAYAGRGGQSRNPYNLAEHLGGSSPGPAIAVASNMCAFSLRTETDSSVRSAPFLFRG